MAGEKRDWRRFQKMKLSRKDFSKRAKRAEGATLRHAHKFIIKRWDNIRSVRRHIITWMVGVALLISIVGIQMLWFQRNYSTAAPASGGAYAEAVKGPIGSLNPLYATSNAEIAATRLLFSSLYSYDPTGHLRGDLATRMQSDATGKTYTIDIRRNARWQDGFALTAKDVAFTVNLMKNSATRATNRDANYSSWKDVAITVQSDYRVQFTLPGPYASFPQALTFSVLPEHLLKDVNPQIMREAAYSNNPVGSGPFALRLLQSINSEEDRKIVHMGAFENYYRGKPRLDRFQLHAYGTDERLATAIRTGEVGAAADVTSETARSIDTKKYEIIAKPVNSGVYAIFNTTQPNLKEVSVRRALQIGTDTSKLRKDLYGNPRELSLPFIGGQLTGSDIPKVPVPNVDEAKRLLETSGWVAGSDGIRKKAGEPLKLRIVTRKNGEFERSLESIVGQWRQLGVQVEAQIVDPTEVGQSFTQAILQPRNYDVLIDELLIGADPDVFAYWHSRGILNFSNYSNATSDDALASARTRSEPELRNVKYKAFAEQWLEDAPAIGLYQSNMLYAHTRNTRSIANDESLISSTDRYANVIYWTAEQTRAYKTP